MTSKKTGYNIINGPCRADLFSNCEYAYDKYSRISLQFIITIGTTAPASNPDAAYITRNITDVKIISIQHEDGSGSSFNIEGYCKASLPYGRREPAPYRFRAYYNAGTRKGFITFMSA